MEEKPLYLQVEERLRANIESGAWGPGEQVPGEQILCKQLGVSRGAISRAMQTVPKTPENPPQKSQRFQW